MEKRRKNKTNTIAAPEEAHLTPEQNEIYQWLQTVRFRRNFFGGLDEADVWKKLEELNALYEKAMLAERERYRGLLSRVVPRSAKQTQEGEQHG